MTAKFDRAALKRYRLDPIAFIEEILVDPESGQPFVLLPAERAFLKYAFKTGPDGRLLFPDQARDLHGAEFEAEQRRLDRELEDGMIDDEEETEEDPRRMWMHEHEDEAPPDEELQARRRWWMKKVGDFMLAHGKDEAAVRAALNDMPRTGLEHLGGALDDDVDTVMEKLTGMGGSSTTGPGYEDSPKAGDKRRAHDRKLALDAKRERRERRDFLRRFPEAARLEPKGNDFANYGDRPAPELAMDEQSDGDDGRFAEWYPMLANLRVE